MNQSNPLVHPSLRDQLVHKRALIGLLVTFPNHAVEEIAAISGYDFLLLDGEHGLFTEQDFLSSIRVLASTPCLVMIRVSGHDTHAIGRCLDLGADIILVPNVSTVDQARGLARAMEYPPEGTRGFGAPVHRSTRYGADLSAHLAAPRGKASLLLLIESELGVQNVEEIVAVDNVDGVIIGPSDLSADLGRIKDFGHARYAEALARVERAAVKARKILGTAPHPGYPLEALLHRGHQIFILDADSSLIREAMETKIAAAKAVIENVGFAERDEKGSASVPS